MGTRGTEGALASLERSVGASANTSDTERDRGGWWETVTKGRGKCIKD